MLQDCRYALRMMRKNVLFSTLIIAVLALGIGAHTDLSGARDRPNQGIVLPAASLLSRSVNCLYSEEFSRLCRGRQRSESSIADR
jgi:hypothetical protein